MFVSVTLAGVRGACEERLLKSEEGVKFSFLLKVCVCG